MVGPRQASANASTCSGLTWQWTRVTNIGCAPGGCDAPARMYALGGGRSARSGSRGTRAAALGGRRYPRTALSASARGPKAGAIGAPIPEERPWPGSSSSSSTTTPASSRTSCETFAARGVKIHHVGLRRDRAAAVHVRDHHRRRCRARGPCSRASATSSSRASRSWSRSPTSPAASREVSEKLAEAGVQVTGRRSRPAPKPGVHGDGPSASTTSRRRASALGLHVEDLRRLLQLTAGHRARPAPGRGTIPIRARPRGADPLGSCRVRSAVRRGGRSLARPRLTNLPWPLPAR